MSHVRSARKKDAQRTTRKPTGKSGLKKVGWRRKQSSLPPTPRVNTVVPQAKYHTIPKSISMGRQVIWCYQGCRPYVDPVITVDIPDASSVRLAEKLAQNPKVNRAIVALLNVIGKELSIAENTGTGDGMPITRDNDRDLKSG